jgi:prepilin-type N-terminal cleavage/methylation domain-containing protein
MTQSGSPVVRALRKRLSHSDDTGFSLMELMVALVIFSVFITIVISSVVAITKASTKVQTVARTTSSELAAFQRLDRQIRYADAINFPGTGTPSGGTYIEFRIPASSTVNNVTLCTQWRYIPSTGTLQSRTWADNPTPSFSTWETEMSNVFNDAVAGYPFLLTPATGTGAHQTLTLSLDGGTSAVKGTTIQSVFIARNSSVQSPSNAQTHTAGVSDTPICAGATRP